MEKGQGGLPKLVLAGPGGGRAEVYLHGAHVTSWLPAAGAEERLYLSPRARFEAGAPIRGGIPVCFPQFADQGPLPQHGFARTMEWEPAVVEVASAVLRLTDTAATRAVWPHPFCAEVAVSVSDGALEVSLGVTNRGDMPVEFTCALHTYLRVDDVSQATLAGLGGSRYRDKVTGRDGIVDAEAELRFRGETDRVYYAVPSGLELREPGRATGIGSASFSDTVLWNPGASRSAALEDLGPDGYRHMVCVEAAMARAPVVLYPGGCWRGTQRLGVRSGR